MAKKKRTNKIRLTLRQLERIRAWVNECLLEGPWEQDWPSHYLELEQEETHGGVEAGLQIRYEGMTYDTERF